MLDYGTKPAFSLDLAAVRILGGPFLGDRHRVLEVGGQGAVLGRDRPFVVVEVHVRAPGGDHRLDRKGHAGLELRAPAGLAEVRDLRLLVVGAADPVADQGAHDREAGTFHDQLDGM